MLSAIDVLERFADEKNWFKAKDDGLYTVDASVYPSPWVMAQEGLQSLLKESTSDE